MNIEEEYQKVLVSLESGARALRRFEKEELLFLAQSLETSLTQDNPEQIEKILCLIDHSALSDVLFEAVLLKTLNLELPPRILVFALNCSRKHIIQSRFKKGQRLDFPFLDVLSKLLTSKSPEVVEWTLRTIEECGNQGVFFLKEFDKIKPPPWKWFNPHQRAVREIITMLERRWSRFEKKA